MLLFVNFVQCLQRHSDASELVSISLA